MLLKRLAFLIQSILKGNTLFMKTSAYIPLFPGTHKSILPVEFHLLAELILFLERFKPFLRNNLQFTACEVIHHQSPRALNKTLFYMQAILSQKQEGRNWDRLIMFCIFIKFGLVFEVLILFAQFFINFKFPCKLQNVGVKWQIHKLQGSLGIRDTFYLWHYTYSSNLISSVFG